MLRSVNSVSEEDGMHHAYPVEFLQQLNASGLPPALLCLKVGSPVILLRNLDPGEGLCNGTRMVVLNVRRKVLQQHSLWYIQRLVGVRTQTTAFCKERTTSLFVIKIQLSLQDFFQHLTLSLSILGGIMESEVIGDFTNGVLGTVISSMHVRI